MKKCPRDGTRLSLIRVSGVVLDKCHHCDGIWCDAGELKELKRAKVKEVEEALEKSYGNPLAQVEKLDGPMRCPVCDGRLIEQTYAVTLPMRIDKCDSCFGIWFDDRELDAALGKPKQKESPRSRPLLAMLESMNEWLS